MSEDQVGGDALSVDVPVELDGGALQFLAKEILEDCLQNIIADVAKEVHREEKLLRMNSAATIADQAALAQTTEIATPVTKGAPPPPPNIRVETPGAVFENGKIYLRGNPFKTTPEIICAKCKLPKLLYPIMGKGSQPPDLSREYCMHYPLVSKPGVDVYGNPFPTDQAKMTKKEREQLRRAEKDNTPGSQDATTNAEGINKLNTGGKPASYIPWHTCPTCKRSLLITRFSQHLEKCLGISGRQSSRNAMAKLNGQNGNTPLESRTGTPQPGASQGSVINSKKSPIKRAEGDGEGNDEEAGDTPKKKKKSSYVKKADREKLAAAAATGAASSSSSKNSKSSSKRPPKDKSESTTDGIKREREDNNDGDAPRKKIKLIKEDSSYTMGGEDGGPSPGSTAD